MAPLNRIGNLILGVVGAFILVAAVSVIGFIIYLYVTNRAFEQTLATNLNVSGEWIEISPDPLLQTRRQVAEVAIDLPGYHAERGGPFEIKLSDGRIVRAQVQAVDVNGNVLDLRHNGFNYTGSRDLIIFTPKGGFPEGEYRTVRIRSDQPFTIERMFWRERNPK